MPRNFCWIIKDHLAVSERPGGCAPNHRKVRRQEELLWLRAHGFNRIVSLLASTHNIHAYEEFDLHWSRFPMSAGCEPGDVLAEMYPTLHGWLRNGEQVLIHQEELNDWVMGVAAGYLFWSGIIPDGPSAVTAAEQLFRRQMGTVGRLVVAAGGEVAPPEGSGHPGEMVGGPLIGEEPPCHDTLGVSPSDPGSLAGPEASDKQPGAGPSPEVL
jgi:hypothetical protein